MLWVLWASLAWWVEPRESAEAQLDRDLAAGRVVTYERASGWRYARLAATAGCPCLLGVTVVPG